jgi:hypothetical protein
VERVLTAETTRRFGGDYDPGFYLAALRYAQSLWQEGKAAQALLQLNKALMAKLDGTESVLHRWPLPYAAKRWVIENCPEDEFLGNPVRHYQHLASRMSGPRPELRTWRAWGCFYLAESLLPAAQYPRDEEQIRKEALAIPSCGYVLEQVEALGLPGEAALLRTVMGA